jgi:hypothetical protein
MVFYVYCLTHELYEGYCKIGFTERDITKRISELETPTGVLGKFKLEFYIKHETINYEKIIHKRLEEKNYQRYNRKEFFKCTPEQAKEIMSEYGEILYELNHTQNKNILTNKNYLISYYNRSKEPDSDYSTDEEYKSQVSDTNGSVSNDEFRPYNKPNMDYINDEQISKLIKSPKNAICNLVKLIYFDLEHKENWNIYAPGKKPDYSYLQVWDGEDWIYQDKKVFVLEKIEELQKLLNTYIENHIDELNEELLELIIKYIVILSDKELKIISENIKLIIYNECRKLGINPKLTLTVTLEN